MRADAHLLTEAGLIAEATAEAVRRSGATPVNLRKLLRNSRLAKGMNPSGPQDDWPASTPAAERDYEANLRAQQEQITAAIRQNGGFPLPWNHPLVQARPDMRFESAFTPCDPNTDGRSSTAAAIKNIHKSGGQNELKRYFGARLVKTDRDLENERQATAKAEAALTAPRKVFIGNHMSLSDPYGDTLRKNDAHPTALEAIAKALSRRPGQLSKVTGMPPQDDDSREDNTTADDGATLASTAAASDRRSSDYNPRATTSQLGPSHAASINRRPSLPPTMDGAATTADPDPARVGAVSADETVDAIKMIHAAGAQPMWSGR